MPPTIEFIETSTASAIKPRITIVVGGSISSKTDHFFTQGIRSTIANLSVRHQLNASEVQRLLSILDAWPEDLWNQGVNEELGDILAARVLSQLKPLTLEDARELQSIFTRR
jgi:hypothetical protein